MSASAGSDLELADQIRLSGLATAKLKRQQQRIQENDAALVTTKSKMGRKSKTEWRPFSLAHSDEEDDDESTALQPAPRLTTPFDVHAKPFRPTTSTSRENFPFNLPAVEGVHSLQLAPSGVFDKDEGPEFQLVTGKKMKPSSRPALHLNAYESKTTEKASTVAAPFCMKEIREVFGNDLPPPGFVQANPGYKDGQVQFVMHPNGDVSAQVWSISKYQWTNIGQYSNIRHRREGMLAASRLRGETEQQSLMQNTLLYFRAVAKQHEALLMGLPWGPKEVSAVLPAPHVEGDNVIQKVDDARKSDATLALPSYTVASRLPVKPLPNNFENRAIPTFTRDDTQSSLESMSFGFFPAGAMQSDISISNNQVMERATTVSSLGDTNDAPMNVARSGEYAGWSIAPSDNSTYTKQDTWSTNAPTMTRLNDINGPAQSHSALTPPTWRADRSGSRFPSFNQGWQTSDRSAVKDYLHKLGETASARSMGVASAGRTVLHDPMQTQGETPVRESLVKKVILGHETNGTSPSNVFDYGFQTFDPEPSTQPLHVVDAAKARRDLRVVSEPDTGPWSMRKPQVVDVNTPRALSHEQLALYSRPTPQNWHGPFFTGDSQEVTDQQTRDAELHGWFMGGNKHARQDDFYERIKAAHYATTPRKRSPGPIGRPSSTAHDKNEEPSHFNERMNRLLIPVLENLASYVEGLVEKRHGPFARYAPPPEWCIDRSANGNKTFFGEDWGKAPERIGRDFRYRAMPVQNRFGNFDTHVQAPIGTSMGLGRSVQPLEGRFRSGLGRKW